MFEPLVELVIPYIILQVTFYQIYSLPRRWRSPGAFSFACVGAAMANETCKFVQAKSKQAMKQVLGIKNEAARMKVTPPLAVASLAHGDDMRWNPNDNGIDFNP